MEEKRRNKSKKKTLFDPRSSRVRAVCRCVCPALSHSFPFCLFCSRACIRATAARCCSRSMLEYITRRDLYSRLTSLCEGRIRSDTSLVCTSTVQPCVFDSLPCSLSLSFLFLLPLSSCLSFLYALLGPVRSSGGFTVTACTRPYRHFRHPRDFTKAQLDGSNWTANDRAVIRTNTFPLLTHFCTAKRERDRLYVARRVDTFSRRNSMGCACFSVGRRARMTFTKMKSIREQGGSLSVQMPGGCPATIFFLKSVDRADHRVGGEIL